VTRGVCDYRIGVSARVGGALAAMGFGVGRGRVVGAHGGRGGGECDGVGAEVWGRGLGAGSGMDQWRGLQRRRSALAIATHAMDGGHEEEEA
jgi:hypothetical protein